MNEVARDQAFDVWLRNARGASLPQRPELELLAEHRLMTAVLAAMEEEARRLLRGAELRPKFWKGVVEFIGNFSHRIHRVKEERFFFPALEAWGVLQAEVCQRLEEDHVKLKELTFLLCDGVNEGDWEKAFRTVAIYVARMRAHLSAEERRMLSEKLAEVGDDRIGPLSASFAELEREELANTGRLHYLEIASSLCRDVGFEPPRASTRA